MKKNVIMMIVLAILVLVSVVQAVQLVSLNNSLAEGSVILGGGSPGGSVTGGPSGGGISVPSSLDNLPTMVGGC